MSQPTPSDVPSISGVIPSEVIPKSEQGKAWNTGGITVRGSGIPCVRCVTCHSQSALTCVSERPLIFLRKQSFVTPALCARPVLSALPAPLPSRHTDLKACYCRLHRGADSPRERLSETTE